MPIDSPEEQSDRPEELRQQSPSVEEVVNRLDRLWTDEKPEPFGPFASLAGTQVGAYAIERIIGRGAFGVVYKARDQHLNRDVAMKIPRPEVILDAETLGRFKLEARATAQLDHPYIVPLYEADIAGATPYLASAFCPGPNLQQWLDESPNPVPSQEAARFVTKIASAVQYAHEQGIVHRDLKPSNILLAPISSTRTAVTLDDFEPRLTDFGLSRFIDNTLTATRSGVRLGTPRYMAPEQAVGTSEEHGPATDVYSLGVLLYQLVAGRLPFDGNSEFEIVSDILNSEAADPGRYVESVSADLSAVCLKCIEKNPEKRYSTAGDLSDDLFRFLNGQQTVARPITKVSRVIRWSRRNPAVAGLLFVLTVSMAAGIAGTAVHLQMVANTTEKLSTAASETQSALDDAQSAESTVRAYRKTVARLAYLSDIKLAFELQNRGEFQRLNALLAKYDSGSESDLRGPEWYVLRAALRAQYREIGHVAGAITECVQLPDGLNVCTAGVDGLVRVWNTQSRDVIKSFDPAIGELHALAVSPNGTTIAAGGQPRMPQDVADVMLIDLSSGDIQATGQSHATTIESVAFSPDGRWLASGSRYQPVKLTRLDTAESFTLPSDQRNRGLSFSSDSRFLSFCAERQRIRVWSLDTGLPVELHPLPTVESGHVYYPGFAPGLPLLATTYTNNDYVAIFDVGDPHLCALAMGSGRAAHLTCLAFSPDAGLLAAGDEAGTAMLWNSDLQRLHRDEIEWSSSSLRIPPAATISPHNSRITSVVLPDSSTVITSAEDGRLVRTNPFAFGGVQTRLHTVVTAATLHNGSLILGCDDGTIRECNVGFRINQSALAAGKIQDIDPAIAVFEGKASITGLAANPDGTLIAVGTADGDVFIVSRKSGEIIRQLRHGSPETESNPVNGIAFSSDGRLVSHTGDYLLAAVHDIHTGMQLLSTSVPAAGWSVAFLPGDQQLAVAGSLEGIRIIDVQTGELVRTIYGQGTSALTFSPRHDLLASVHNNGNLNLSQMSDKSESFVVSNHRGFGRSVTFSADGRTAISLGSKLDVHFVDTNHKQLLGQLPLTNDSRIFGTELCAVFCSDELLVAVVGGIEGAHTDLYTWSLQSTDLSGRPNSDQL